MKPLRSLSRSKKPIIKTLWRPHWIAFRKLSALKREFRTPKKPEPIKTADHKIPKKPEPIKKAYHKPHKKPEPIKKADHKNALAAALDRFQKALSA